MTANERYAQWLTHITDQELLLELQTIKGNDGAISDRFFRELAFGTGGLRGEIGAGTNNMNIVTVARATRGLCAYLREKFESPGLAIGFDNRRNSTLFAKTAAKTASACGVKVYLFDRLLPTPVLSYAVRALHCAGGIMITASHNPREYNGYKVYGEDGCQITDEAAEAIEKKIAETPYFGERDEARDDLISPVPDTLLDQYLNRVSALAPGDERAAKNLKIIYTPLNGTGLEPVTKALQMNGFADVFVVPEQRLPDPNFTTCPYPNPEMPEAMQKGIECLTARNADLLLATDPDCDRVGTAIIENGKPRLFSGNEMGVLLLDYLCRTQTLPKHPVAVKTIVTTDMAKAIAAAHGIELREVLTGFKYIGEQIALLEREGRRDDYFFGFEESYGYLSGADVRDKDGVNAALLICRMTADYKARGMTLTEAMAALEETYGAYAQALESHAFKGESGMKHMADVMDALRNAPPGCVMGKSLRSIGDYEQQIVTDTVLGSVAPSRLPRSNVLKYLFEDDFGAVVRPSGTEPKLKIYLTARGKTREQATKALAAWQQAVGEYLVGIGM